MKVYKRQVWPIEGKYIEDITRWREDMNFMFEWQEQYIQDIALATRT